MIEEEIDLDALIEIRRKAMGLESIFKSVMRRDGKEELELGNESKRTIFAAVALHCLMSRPDFPRLPKKDEDTRIDDLYSLSTRTVNCLKAANVFWLSELAPMTEESLLRIPNLGKKSLKEIKDELAKFDRSSLAQPSPLQGVADEAYRYANEMILRAERWE
jgi:DNA-directed RNA polymerase alpha subunit